MDAARFERIHGREKNIDSDRSWLVSALLLVGGAILGALAWWNLGDARQTAHNELYLLPWIALVAIVVSAPPIYLFYRKKFDLFHPLVFAAWSYFFPAFVVGGLILALGIFQPYFMFLIGNPEYNLPLTFFYIALGYAGLTAGFVVPWARQIGEWMSRRAIPAWNWRPSETIFPGIVLLAVGTFFYFSAWIAGSVGYRQLDVSDSFSAANYFFSLLTLEASLILWLFIFKTRNLKLVNVVLLSLLMMAALSRVILGGNKSSLLMIVILVMMAFVYSGRRLGFKQGFVFFSVGLLALLIGVIYGTTFRQIKGSEDRTGISEYLSHAERTLIVVTSQDTVKTLNEGFMNILGRIETGSTLAVVVANYEELAPYEAAYDLDNNIWKYTWTAFIPRFVWRDKPIIADARGYSDLYFNFGENSFAITPMGDLLRNFGPFGIPLGMMLLGFVLRIIYAALIENQTVTIGRAAAYYMLLTVVSYEGFYGTIMPSLIRVSVVAFISLFLVDFIIKRQTRA